MGSHEERRRGVAVGVPSLSPRSGRQGVVTLKCRKAEHARSSSGHDHRRPAGCPAAAPHRMVSCRYELTIELGRESKAVWIAEVPGTETCSVRHREAGPIQRVQSAARESFSTGSPTASCSRFGQCRIRHCRMSSWPRRRRSCFRRAERIGWRHGRTWVPTRS